MNVYVSIFIKMSLYIFDVILDDFSIMILKYGLMFLSIRFFSISDLFQSETEL